MKSINSILLEELKRNNNIITTAEVIRLGFTKQLLSKYAQEGLLERVRQGVYMTPDSIHDDMYTMMLRSEHIIFSHESALFLNGLSDRTPFIHTITLPSNKALPGSIRDECICFYIKPELHGLGVTLRQTSFGNTVRCYDLERTICDLLRTRDRCDEETVISALKNYAEFKDMDLNRLGDYAARLKVQAELKRYMEVLI